VAWTGEGASPPRSWWYELNSLDPIAPLLEAYKGDGDPRFVGPAAAFALDWVRAHPTVDDGNPFAWYDMAIGKRAYRLGYLLDVVARLPAFTDDEVAELLQALQLHLRVLADDDGFAAHSNHGIYQAGGQLAVARRFPGLPGADAARSQGHARLRGLVERQFTAEGVHREHSPRYHLLVLLTFARLVRAGAVEDEWVARTLSNGAAALAWFLQPDAHLVNFGDTDRRRVTVSEAELTGSEELLHAATSGRRGRFPEATVRAFPESGYFVVRQPAGLGEAGTVGDSYLALNAAFHSRTHKHADDLSFVWFDRGVELLVDAGSFGFVGRSERGSALWEEGFWYSHPSRVFVESTRAHNTVEIDGRSFSRRGEPYGSALTRWASAQGTHAVEAKVRHFDTVEHTRALLFRPGRWLLVADWVQDTAGTAHDLAQSFQFAPSLDVGRAGDRFFVPLGPETALHVAPLAPVEAVEHDRGRDEPDPRGWVSRRKGEMTPCWSVAFRAEGTARHHVATLFAFGSEPPAVRAGGDPWGSTVRWSWTQDGRAWSVGLDRAAGDSSPRSLVTTTFREVPS
jgi:hypothetical protein